jgi:acetyl esterase/lipase
VSRSAHGGLTRRDVLRAGAALAVAACGRGESTRDALPAPHDGATRVAYGPAAPQVADLRLPPTPGPHPVVVLIHGGFWLPGYDLRLMEPLAAALTAFGYATWNVEYRALGDDGGGWPGTFLDVAAAADRLRALAAAQALDLGRVTSLGHSAGGTLALWLAGRRRVAAGPLRADDPLPLARAVSIAGIADLRRFAASGSEVVVRLLGGDPDAVPERYAAASPTELLPLGVPQMLVHGRDDRIVAVAGSERYVAAARGRGDDATLVALGGVGHFEPIDPASAAWSAVLSAVAGQRAARPPRSPCRPRGQVTHV